MTAAEIAKIAGVSRSTVTGVVNDYPFISEETKKKVRAVIEQYGYVPNSSARGLAGKKPKIIGLFIYNLNDITTSMYYSSLITEIIDKAEKQQYNVLVSIIKDNNKKRISNFFMDGSIQGAVISGGREDEEEVIKLINSGYNVIVVDQISEKTSLAENAGIVNRNNFKGGYLATEYLIKKGHKQILHITGLLFRNSARDRMEGYKKALEDNNIPYDESLILHGDFSDTTSESLVESFIKSNQKIDAIFACNDMSALGAIRALKKMNVRVPEDISIIGFDDIFLSKEIQPELTTIRAHTSDVSSQAVRMLVNLIEKRKSEKIKIVDVELIERNSVL